MPKTKYWMTDGYGTAALVEGAEERDRWLPLGWRVVDGPEQPSGVTHVWLRHEEHNGRQRFAAGAVELWQAKGWHPSDPPPPTSPFNADQPADVVIGPAAIQTETTETAPTVKTKEK
ncbi:hypothetical protein [Micromonospora carbonacea]|uniref:Uncharacterized protein n=1 Tax=Micromonospora carbonacea TaxID=47853 RepID=A0A1C5A2T1_9ACTN|nr:hypothetical protein [Micromonospora carbonacea]SCF39510.1 hypothetical protein GA0070563_11130 [Micromonospora carbonacea]